MRVAFVSMETAHHRGRRRFERTRRIARTLAGRGHDVTVLCAQWWTGASVPVFEHEGVTYRRVTFGRSPREFAARLPLALRRVDPDVVHAVNTPPNHALVAKTTARFLRVPVVVDWFDDRSEDSRRTYARVVRQADAIITPSEMVRTRVREHGAGDETVRVVPDSIDVDLVREAPVRGDHDVVYARELDEEANVETLLLALAELRGREWSAVVVGDGPDRHAIEGAARDLRIDDRVEFTGDLPLAERVGLYRGANVFAQTAYEEPFATELLWALACGCIGVVEYQADSSAHELVEGRARGRLVTSPQELADEILDAGDLDHRTLDETYAEFDDDEVVERYLSLYRELRESYGLF